MCPSVVYQWSSGVPAGWKVGSVGSPMCVKCVDRGARRGWYEVERCAVVACRSPPTYIRRGAWACLVASIHSMIAVYVSLEEAVCNWGMYTDTTTRSGPMCGVMEAAAMYGLRGRGTRSLFVVRKRALLMDSMVPADLLRVSTSGSTG